MCILKHLLQNKLSGATFPSSWCHACVAAGWALGCRLWWVPWLMGMFAFLTESCSKNIISKLWVAGYHMADRASSYYTINILGLSHFLSLQTSWIYWRLITHFIQISLEKIKESKESIFHCFKRKKTLWNLKKKAYLVHRNSNSLNISLSILEHVVLLIVAAWKKQQNVFLDSNYKIITLQKNW